MKRGEKAINFAPHTEKFLFFSLLFTSFFLPIYNSLTSLGLGLSIFFYLVTLAQRPRSFRITPDFWLLLLFVLLALASLLYTPNFIATAKGLKKLSLYIFLFWAVSSCVNTENRLKAFLLILISSATLVSLDGFYQIATGSDWFSARPAMPYPHLGIRRATASFHQAGLLGIYLGCILPLAISTALSAKRPFMKLGTACAVFILAATLVSTFAPGAALGILAAVSVLACLKRKGWLVLLFAACSAATFLFLPESLTSWPHGSLFGSISGRMEIWKTGLHIFLTHPFLGSGWHTFPHNYQLFCLPAQPHCGGGTPYAHNQYIQMLAELGIAGSIVFWGFTVLLFKKGLGRFYRNRGQEALRAGLMGLLAALAAYMTHGLFESSIYTSQGALLFWILLGLLKAAADPSFDMRKPVAE